MFGYVDFDGNVDDDEDITSKGEDDEYDEDVDGSGDQVEEYEEYEDDDELSRENFEAGYRVKEDYDDLVVLFSNQLRSLKLKNRKIGPQNGIECEVETENTFDGVLDPSVV
ncbi:hypothetical protein glysoja_031427 [Glycine soja]|uniref:Uncharacterized protein n=1 Tax=Glycine soja TaxID=3848 RepID=A0A0B2Q6G2_GLYSO|nr:hypothetical protein glysoja_031427 [Glycine soja]